MKKKIYLLLFALLSGISIIGAIAFIIVGRKISHTPGQLGVDLVGWILLYGLIAPFWLIRSVSDVASGKKRGWRG